MALESIFYVKKRPKGQFSTGSKFSRTPEVTSCHMTSPEERANFGFSGIVRYDRGFSRSIRCFWFEGEALVLGVDFCECTSESAPIFPDFLFLFFWTSRVWSRIFRDLSGVLEVRTKLLYPGVDFCACASELLFRSSSRFFQGDITLFPSMLYVVDATSYVLWFYESFDFRVLL